MTTEQQQIKYLSEKEVAERTGLACTFWRAMRYRGHGPVFYKIGRRCLYKWHEVEAWLELRRVEPKKAS